MDFMDISKMRITVRQFDQKPVENEKIEKILDALYRLSGKRLCAESAYDRKTLPAGEDLFL
jgi:hypothetical protein